MRSSHQAVIAPASPWWWLVTTGFVLLAIHAVMLSISPRFAYGQWPVLQRPIGLLVTLMMIAGGVYLAAVWRLVIRRPEGLSRAACSWIVLIGLGMRVLMMPSTPMLETDYFRYLWDGAVLAHGHDPYRHTPRDVLRHDAPAELVELGAASGLVLQRVNHPELTTIYPPVAQAGFAVAHHLAPWRIEGLRFTWLVLDFITLSLLIALLRRLAMPFSAVLIYWWNPLLVKEGYNTVHMEMLLLPCVAAALWLAVRQRLLGSAVALAVAAGAKLWPILLLPALLRQGGQSRRRLAAVAGLGALLSTLIISPMLLSHFGETAGLRAYASHFEVNDSLYQAVHLLARAVTPDSPDLAHRVARLMIGGVLLGWTIWLCRRSAPDGRTICERALWIVAALFLLSPTQLPWYWLWLLPMLMVRPSAGLLLLTATLPLYYLRFPMRELGYSAWFNNGVVWIQFGPPLALLGWEAWRHRRRRCPRTLTDAIPRP